MAFIWDDNKISELTRLWSEGKSASQIAAILGDISRNAIIGKIHRLGLHGRKSNVELNNHIQVEIPIEYDPDKYSKNLFKHQINFNLAKNFEHDKLEVRSDKRKDYGEARKIGIGMIDKQLYCVVYVKRKSKYRIISLRLANSEERDFYDKKRNSL